MIVPQVPFNLMLLANEALTRPQHRLDVINTLLREQHHFGFDLIYAARHRLTALWSAIGEHRLEEWTPRAPGATYGEVGSALWDAAANAHLDQPADFDICAGDVLQFDIDELRRLARDYTPPKTNS
jgi:hypothetical protein